VYGTAPSASLATVVAAFPSPRNVNQGFLVTVTVTNTGGLDATGLAIDAFTVGGTATAGAGTGPTPAVPATLAAGQSVTLTWTFTGTTVGTLDFTATATGKDAASGSPVSSGPAGSAAVVIQAPAALLAALVQPSASLCVGEFFLVTLTVTNTGDAPANGFSVAGPSSVTAGTATFSGPTPAVPGSLAGGAAITLTWTAQGSGPGPVSLSATASGADGNTGGAVTASAAGGTSTTVLAGASLAAAVSSPATTTIGQIVPVVLTVTNTGGADADGVVPSITENVGGAFVQALTGPNPAGPVTLVPGMAQSFTWTFSATGSGAVTFSATGSGTACGGVTIAGQGTATMTSFSPAILSATLTFDRTVAPVGALLRVILTVTNTGGQAADGVGPAIQVDQGSAVLALAGAVAPSGTVLLAPGAAQSFTWTYSVSGVGSLRFTATGSGTDVFSGLPVGAAATASILAAQGMLDVVRITASPTLVGIDQLITVVMTVSSTGGLAVSSAAPTTLMPGGAGSVFLVAGPGPGAAVLTPGATETFVWSWRSIRGGVVTFNGAATAPGVATSPSATSNVVVIQDGAGDLSRMQYYPTPFRPGQAVGGTMKFRRMPPRTQVRIYDAAGGLVRELDADAYGVAEWDARNSDGRQAAGGVYFFAAVAPDGEKKLGKLELVH
jgi:hypothetical protein